MAVLILNANSASALTLSVMETGEENQPIDIGEITPSFLGADRNSIRGQKRQFGSRSVLADTSTKDSIKAAFSPAKSIPISGDLVGNIQTVCTVKYTGCQMVQGTSPQLWKVGLTLAEVQPNVTLLRYSPGDAITGEAFTRSTTAYQINNANNPSSVAINTKRDSHFPVSITRTLLLEDARTNALTAPTDLSNAAWTKTNATITTGIADPTGGTAACTITATASDASVRQFLADAASLARTNSVWLRRRTGTGTINFYNPLDAGATAPTLTASWQRFNNTGGASVSRKFEVIVRTSGDAIDFWIGQLEDGAFASSTIPTAAATRGADSESLPFTYPPQEMSVYVKFVEAGTLLAAGRVFSIENSADANPRFVCGSVGGFYQAAHITAAANASSTLAIAPAIGDTVELVARLFGDGSVDISQTINGAAATSAAQSASNALATAWSGLLAWLNGPAAGANGFIALQSFKIIAGMRSITELRTL